MKKIFTLLLCALAFGFAANADEAMVNQCINTVLDNNPVATTLTAPDMDANHDGVINITDVTTLINQNLAERPQFRSASKQGKTVSPQAKATPKLTKVDTRIKVPSAQDNEKEKK